MSIMGNIKKLRESRNLTQQELAKVLGVDRSTVAQWETGVSSPRMGKAIKMCDYFAISLDDLVSNEDSSRAQRADNFMENNVELDELAALYRSMTDEGRAQLMIFARGLAATYPKNQVDSAIA